jgi:hypothetical protein
VSALCAQDLLHLTDPLLGNRGRPTNPQGSFAANNYGGPFSQQLSGFPVQNPYQMQQWGQQYLNAEMYNRYDPNATANRSPMNVGAWYPPTTYSASPAFNHASSNVSFRGGYPATSASNPYAASTAFNAQTGYSSSSASGAAPFVGFDPDMMAAMASLNLSGAGNAANNGAGNAGANTGAHSGSSTK